MASRNRSRGVAGGTAGERPGDGSREARGGLPAVREAAPVAYPSDQAGCASDDASLIRFHDLAGRPRGTGFVADHHGTVLTSHEAVDGLSRLVLSTAGDRRRVVAAADVTPLPDLGLALVRTGGLGVDPLPLTTRDRVEAGTYVRIAAGGWREARVLGATDVTYAATDRFHLVGDALELAVGTAGRDALRLGGGAAGGPVLDAATGAVLGVLGTALSSGHSDVGFALPLRRAATGPLAGLLAENAATVPAYGADLNLAGVLALTATSVREGRPAAGPGTPEPVERAGTAREFAAFAASRAHVLGLVGAPGSGRTTELAALAARRAGGPEPAPTLWLRGADLHDDDMSVADAVRRTLAGAARLVGASDPSRPARLGDITPERLAHLAGAAGRPLLVLLDGPEEMPPVLAHRLPEWTEGTATWLRETGVRLVVACRPEYWEHAGAEFPGELLYGAVSGTPSSTPRSTGGPTSGPAAAAGASGWVAELPSPRGASAGGTGEAGAVSPSGSGFQGQAPGADPGAGTRGMFDGTRSAEAAAAGHVPVGGVSPGGVTFGRVPVSRAGEGASGWAENGVPRSGTVGGAAAPGATRGTPWPRRTGDAGGPESPAGTAATATRGGPEATDLRPVSAEATCSGRVSAEATRSGPASAEVTCSGPASAESVCPGWVSVEATCSGSASAEPTCLGLASAESVCPGWVSAEAARSGSASAEPTCFGLASAEPACPGWVSAEATRSALTTAESVCPGRVSVEATSFGQASAEPAYPTRVSAEAARSGSASAEPTYPRRASAEVTRSETVYAGPLGRGHAGLPPCVRLGDLRDDEAREARARHGVPEGVLAEADAGHPLTLRLLAEVHAALPGPPAPVPVTRDTVYAAYLDLMCLRIATRLAGENGLYGTAVRRLAAKVSGQVHEAARRSLGPGQGGLDRETFGALFPWGPAPARLGGGTGWASAVLAEGLFVPAGSGYRFAHEALADWIQGTHLDLDEALRALVHRRDTPHGTHALPVPHHRIGSVVEAVLLLARQHGVPQLALTLEELVHALDLDPHSWWATRLLAGVLTRVPDATPYTEVLRLLADGIAERGAEGQPTPQVFGPGFWTALRLPESTRLDLLRRLVLADRPPHEPGPRHLDTVAGLLTADPPAVQPLLVRWFDDERPLPATPHATVATAAQALLHTHRHRGLDGLTEVLVDSAHRRADELLTVLAEEEPSALCRAVERWARDEHPARQTAAVTHGLRTAPHARTGADRTLLRHAALVLLAGPSHSPLRGGALALLVQDPDCRDRHLPRALDHFAACDPYLPPSAVATALPTHPEPVLEAFRARLLGPDAGEALRRLADATTPELTHRVAALVGRAVAERPETAGHLAAYVDRRLDRDPAPRAVLLPLVTRLLDDGPEPARAALATILAADGATAGAPLRRALREHLFAHEQEPAVLDALLHAAARCDRGELRALVHRTGQILVRTPEGATRFDRGLVDLARHVPGFATRLTGWLTDAPGDWAALVGPSTRRTIERLAGARVPA
ncbi:trypsin-like peptidase domain-containing protein [Streptomyces sp. NPDC048405]|uniref:trypsin-like peptidase domain-containing protein n=1 Tax=Streptomyces sp. NPDC048405 TaxID=3365544 RepID=UPI003713F938